MSLHVLIQYILVCISSVNGEWVVEITPTVTGDVTLMWDIWFLSSKTSV